jgi:uncharacterized protein YqjF (DUF2071 family)
VPDLNEQPAQLAYPIDIHASALHRLPIMSQRWENLSFLHWRVDPTLVAPLLPAGTRPDVFDGSSWVGLIPFKMVRAGLGLGPPVPWLGTFAETNVRLYSVDASGRRGVVFRSLETSRLAVVFGSRAAFGVPYMWAKMAIEHVTDTVVYTTTRRFPGPRGAGGRVVVRPGALLTERDPLADFLTARWGLHSRWAGRLTYVPNRHGVWPLHAAELLELDDSLVAAAGLPGIVGRPPDSVLWSPGVKTVFAMPFSV